MTAARLMFLEADTLNMRDDVPVFSSSNSFWELVVLLIVFAFIIVACYYTTKFIGGRQLNQLKHSNFEVIDTYRITQNKFLQLVRMGQKYLVIAVAKDQISVLCELTEDEIIRQEQKKDKDNAFSHVLSDFIKKKDNKG